MRLSQYLSFGVFLNLKLTVAASWPVPEPIQGARPSNNHSTIDPGLIRRGSDKKLFLYTTGNDGTIWTASSLFGPWEQSTKPYQPESERGGGPALYHINGTYYVFSTQAFNYSSIGVADPSAEHRNHRGSTIVATSKTLEPGSWTKHIRLNITWAEKYNILDSSFLTTSDGRNLLSFGSYYTGLYQIPLAATPTELAHGANKHITHLAQNFTKAQPTDSIEASYQYARGGWYYLFFSSGWCCSPKNQWPAPGEEYKIMVCRSKDARGGYVDQAGRECTSSGGTEILGSHDGVFAPGGQGVMDDEEVNGTVLYYHYCTCFVTYYLLHLT